MNILEVKHQSRTNSGNYVKSCEYLTNSLQKIEGCGPYISRKDFLSVSSNDVKQT